MADNAVANAGVGGVTFATDDIGGVHYPIGKITFGALDSQTLAVAGAGAVTAGTQRVTLASDDPAVAALTKLGGVVSSVNSTTANLSGAAVFTGTSEEVKDYAAILVYVFSSHASATDGLSMQQSNDATNWDVTDVFTIPAATGKTFSIQPAARYYRLVYTNGATLTTSLRIMSVYHYGPTKASSQRPSDATSNENDFEQVSAFAHLFNGTTWDRQRGDTTNGLDVDVTRLPSLVAGAATIGAVNIAAAQTLATVTTVGTVTTLTGTTTLTPGTAAANLGKAEDAVHASGDTGVMSLAVRADTAAATGANGDYVPLLTDANGRLHTLDANTAAIQTSVQLIDDTIIADDAAFTVGTTKVNVIGHLADETATDSVDEGDVGASRMTLDRKQIFTPYVHAAAGGSTPYKNLDCDESEDDIKTSAGKLFWIHVVNLAATKRYIKFYDLAAASVTVGTTTPVLTFPIPTMADTNGAGFTLNFGDAGVQFTTAICVAATTGFADNDTGAPGANEVILNCGYA